MNTGITRSPDSGLHLSNVVGFVLAAKLGENAFGTDQQPWQRDVMG